MVFQLRKITSIKWSKLKHLLIFTMTFSTRAFNNVFNWFYFQQDYSDSLTWKVMTQYRSSSINFQARILESIFLKLQLKFTQKTRVWTMLTWVQSLINKVKLIQPIPLYTNKYPQKKNSPSKYIRQFIK